MQRHSASAVREFAEHRDRSTDDARPGLTTIFSGEVRTATIARTAKRASATTVSTPRRCVRRCAHPTTAAPFEDSRRYCARAFLRVLAVRSLLDERHPVRNTTVMAPSKTPERITTSQRVWPTTRSTGSVTKSAASLSALFRHRHDGAGLRQQVNCRDLSPLAGSWSGSARNMEPESEEIPDSRRSAEFGG